MSLQQEDLEKVWRVIWWSVYIICGLWVLGGLSTALSFGMAAALGDDYLMALGILFIPPAIFIGLTKVLKYIFDGFL